MNEAMTIFKDYWAVIMTAVAGLAWLFRLESRSLANEREIKRLSLQREEDLRNAKESRNETRAVLYEIQQDIKKLLQRQRGERD